METFWNKKGLETSLGEIERKNIKCVYCEENICDLISTQSMIFNQDGLPVKITYEIKCPKCQQYNKISKKYKCIIDVPQDRSSVVVDTNFGENVTMKIEVLKK